MLVAMHNVRGPRKVPLTPPLSPSDGEREQNAVGFDVVCIGWDFRTRLRLRHAAEKHSSSGGRSIDFQPDGRSADTGIIGVLEQTVSAKLSGKAACGEKQYESDDLCEF